MAAFTMRLLSCRSHAVPFHRAACMVAEASESPKRNQLVRGTREDSRSYLSLTHCDPSDPSFWGAVLPACSVNIDGAAAKIAATAQTMQTRAHMQAR